MIPRGIVWNGIAGAWQRTRTYPAKSASSCRVRRLSSFPTCVDKVVVTCLPGLEKILSIELRALGLDLESSKGSRKKGRVTVRKVAYDDLFRCCLYLGSASSIRWHCASFSARGMAELRRKTAKIDWRMYLKDPLAGSEAIKSNLQSLDVRAVASKSKLYHTAAIRERVLLGIYESFGYSDIDKDDIARKSNDSNKDIEDTRPIKRGNLLLDVHIERDQVDIYINAFPTPLHQRGYRFQVAKAPLREDLAYSMLLFAGWAPSWIPPDIIGGNVLKREWQGLVDPFCGSGTIAIEGAAMAAGLPPGRFQADPFQGTVLEDSSKWESLVRAASITSVEDSDSFRVSASDRDAGAVQATMANAKRAGVWKYFENNIHHSSISGQPWFEHPSQSPSNFLVVTNPPFGKRVSNKNKLLPLYQTLGHSIQQVSKKHGRNVRGVLLTDDPRFVSKIGPEFPLETLLRTSHGGVKVSAVELKILTTKKQ